MFKLFHNEFNRYNAVSNFKKDSELIRLHRLLKEQIKEKFDSKLKLYILDSGSCNACELELQTLFSPLYNISDLGVEVVYSIKKADILLITGLMTENMYTEALVVYEELNEHKRVISIGDCPLLHAPFKDNFALRGQLSVIPTSFHIAGCPPNPKELLRGLHKYLKKL